jgi:hypothetical protein
MKEGWLAMARCPLELRCDILLDAREEERRSQPWTRHHNATLQGA